MSSKMTTYISTHIDWFNYDVLIGVLKDKTAVDTRNLLIKCLTETDKHNKYAMPLSRLLLSFARGIPADWFIVPNGNNCGLVDYRRSGIGIIWDDARMNLVGAIHLMNGVEVDSITILPAYRNKGIATRILTKIRHFAQAHHYPIFAMVSSNAKRCFEKAGFINEGKPLDDGTFFHYAPHNKDIHTATTTHNKEVIPINLGAENTLAWVKFLYFSVPLLIKNLKIPGEEMGEMMAEEDKDEYYLQPNKNLIVRSWV